MSTDKIKEQYSAFVAARKESAEKVDYQVELENHIEFTVEVSKQD